MLKKSPIHKLVLLVVVSLTTIIAFVGCANSDTAVESSSDFVKVTDSKDLVSDFKTPPETAKPWAFWWWLEGNISKAGIRRDLKAMKKVGLEGAIIYDAGSSSYNDVKRTEPGPRFMSPESKELFAYAVKVADSLGLGLSMNIVSGWNDGGRWVTREMAAKKIAWSHETVTGPAELNTKLNLPDDLLITSDSLDPYFKPVAVLAVKRNSSGKNAPPLKNFDLKALHRLTHEKFPNKGGYDWERYLQEDTLENDQRYDAKLHVIDISDKVSSDGTLRWKVPVGTYEIYRFGYTGTGAKVSTHSPGGGGLAIDYMSSQAMDLQFDHTIGEILPKVQPYVGTGLRFLHDDSWELGMANWTAGFVSEFKNQHGYSPVPYLPILTGGMIIENSEVSNRFLYDYRRTVADLIAKNHYGRLKTLAHQNGMGIHPEGGGPHPAPIDGLKNLGINDIPMGEFWAKVNTHRVGDYERIFVKQSASAAHTYGKKLVQAEGPTSIGPQWEMDPQHMKPTLDRAFCEGLNRLAFHTFTHSPKSAGKPGIEYFAGTHFNPNITWWDQAPALVNYVSRVQLMLQQGKFVGDVLYYYGDNVPNQVPLKRVQPGLKLPEGYDYDVADTEVILNRTEVQNHRISLPDGMQYQVLVLPNRSSISLDVLKKLQQLVKDGATVVGPRPSAIPGLSNHKQADEQVRAIANEMWGDIEGRQIMEHSYGKGKVIWRKKLKDILSEKQIIPDFIYTSSKPDTFIDYLHRETEDTEIYFLANRTDHQANFKASFRVSDKAPELWDPVNGEIVPQSIYSTSHDRLNLPIHLEPYGSIFVVFRDSQPEGQHYTSVDFQDQNIYPLNLERYDLLPRERKGGKLQFVSQGTYDLKDSDRKTRTERIDSFPSDMRLEGPWKVHFSPEWGGPDSVQFDVLSSWTKHRKPGIKYYSGTAVYQKSFRIDSTFLDNNYRLELNLGAVHSLAEVIVNGVPVDTLWKKPFKANISGNIQEGKNSLKVKVVNLWPNRIIGDQFLSKEEQYSHTNVTKFTKDYPLLTSGLLGPVEISFYPVK